MFTGIITHIGEIINIERRQNCDQIIDVAVSDIAGNSGNDAMLKSLGAGSSICCSGICLTATAIHYDKSHDRLQATFQLSKETVDKSTAKDWEIADKVNIEFSLKAGDELGGHIVSGHVDGEAKLIGKEQIQESWSLRFKPPGDLCKFIAKKGSVALDGVSLTVNEVDEESFWVNIIPHSWENTTLNRLDTGDMVNIEVDMLARYAERLLRV